MRASPTSHEDKTAPGGGGARGNSVGAPAHRDRGLAKRRTPHCRSREVVREVQEPAPGAPAETGRSSAGRDGGGAGLSRSHLSFSRRRTATLHRGSTAANESALK